MFKLENLLFLAILFAGTSLSTLSQPKPNTPPPPALLAKTKGIYYCYEGSFSVEIPTPYHNANAFPVTLKASQGLGVGESYSWLGSGVVYHVQYIDLVGFSDALSSRILKNSASNITANQVANKGKLIYEKDFSASQLSGKDLKYEFSNKISKYRVFLDGKRLFVIYVDITNLKIEPEVSAFLESFRQIDSQLLIARKIAEAEPKPLPQNPIVKKERSDAQDFGLKGKVKSVSQKHEYLSEPMKSVYVGKFVEFENYYNEQGTLTRQVLFGLIGGLHNKIRVYGYIDNKRVSSTNTVIYQNSEENILESLEYGTKYDEKGRLSEEIEGDFKTVYFYNDNKQEKTTFYKGNKLGNRIITSFDEKSNEIEVISVYEKSSGISSKDSFTYESFDKNGNWTKRKQTSIYVNGKSPIETEKMEFRDFVYYD
jgi:hypothetical protein